jgi:hypothetical protein
MRIISLDLLLGTPRLQRRIDAEQALLQRDLALVEDNTRQLRTGIARTATSLPALAAATAGGFLATRLASARRHRPVVVKEGEPHAALAASTSLAWQVLMPLLVSWVQARFAPPTQDPDTEPTKP